MVANFSFDIVNEILLRLPVKSLLRFRSIDKNCCNIIDNLSFANMHAVVAEEPQILPLPVRSGHGKSMHSFVYDDNENVVKESEHPILKFSTGGGFIDHIGYGLLCFRSFCHGGEIYLCNPLRGEFLELPRPPPSEADWLLDSMMHYGIGFDSTNNTYKMVRGYEFEAEVYTLGSGSWRKISSPVCLSWVSERSVYAYGDIHWMNWDSTSRRKCIISFVFGREEFNEISLPKFEYQQHYRKSVLINLKGHLAIVSFPSVKNIEIWVLKDFENKKEWIREYIISTQIWAKQQDNTVVVRNDIYFWEDLCISVEACSCGLIFQAYWRKKMFVLDLKTERIWYMQGHNLPERFRFYKEMSSYTGSVLSLRNFGNGITKGSQEYNFLKTARKVYVSP